MAELHCGSAQKLDSTSLTMRKPITCADTDISLPAGIEDLLRIEILSIDSRILRFHIHKTISATIFSEARRLSKRR